jgi:hypothetical protein
MVHRHKRPVGDYTSDAHSIRVVRGRSRTSNEVLNRRSVEQLNVWELQHFAQQRRREERCVLDDNEVSLVIVGDTDFVQEELGRLAHHHGAEELPAQPGAATWSNASFDHGDLEVRALGSQGVGGAETAGSGANDDNVGLGVAIKVVEIATRHSARNLGLADGSKGEGLPVVLHLVESLGNAVGSRLDSKVLLEAEPIFGAVGGSWDVESSGWRRHGDVCSRVFWICDLLRMLHMGEGARACPCAGIIQIKL